MRILYAAGPGDIIAAHKHWALRQADPTQVSLTYSGQFADFVKKHSAQAYLVSQNPQQDFYRDGDFTLEHRQKRKTSGLGYHISELTYGIGLLQTAIAWRADVFVMSSGTSHYFIAPLFRIFGIKFIAVLHNTLWPNGSPPKGLAKLLMNLNAIAFRYFISDTIGISPACIRQVASISDRSGVVMFPQYQRCSPPSKVDHRDRPFRIFFAGRLTESKGVFDLVEIAKRLEKLRPSQVEWTVCGDGNAMLDIKRVTRDLPFIKINGWTDPEQIITLISQSHAVIVPTKSSFPEGMAKTAVEAMICGKPVITSPVTPALEVCRSACVEAKTDNIESYVCGIVDLLDSSSCYDAMCEATKSVSAIFFDRRNGFSAALEKVLGPMLPGSSTRGYCRSTPGRDPGVADG